MVAWGNHEPGDGIRPILRRSLEALLQRERSFAHAFLRDRRTFQRIVKSMLLPSRDDELRQQQQELHGRSPQRQSSRLERSAGLHCIVLALRLARIDDFTAEMFLPVLIAGSLSGVVQYPEVPENEWQQQDNPAAEMPSSAATDDHDNGGQQKKENTLWPVTSLTSAEELAAHAVVNPMVTDCVHWQLRNTSAVYPFAVHDGSICMQRCCLIPFHGHTQRHAGEGIMIFWGAVTVVSLLFPAVFFQMSNFYIGEQYLAMSSPQDAFSIFGVLQYLIESNFSCKRQELE